MTRRLLLPIVLAVATAACVGAAVRIPLVTEADARRGAGRFPGLTAGDLSEGRTLFSSKCGACHLPPAPSSKHPDVWPGEIAEMKQRAHLDERQAQLIERYLVTMATRPVLQASR